MGRKCSVCSHPDRAAIDELLVGGGSNRGIARQFSLTADAVERHARAHLPKTLTRAAEVTEVARADGLFAQLREQQARGEDLYRETQSILRRALRVKDLDLALTAIRSACACLRENRGALGLMLQVTVAGVEVEVLRRLTLVVDEMILGSETITGPEMFSRLLAFWKGFNVLSVPESNEDRS